MKTSEIIDYWTNKTKDTMCYNCSFVFVNGLCPCRIEHMAKEFKKYWHTTECTNANDRSLNEVCIC